MSCGSFLEIVFLLSSLCFYKALALWQLQLKDRNFAGQARCAKYTLAAPSAKIEAEHQRSASDALWQLQLQSRHPISTARCRFFFFFFFLPPVYCARLIPKPISGPNSFQTKATGCVTTVALKHEKDKLPDPSLIVVQMSSSNGQAAS